MLVNSNALSRHLQGVSVDLSVVRQTSASVTDSLLRKRADLICSQIRKVVLLEDEETVHRSSSSTKKTGSTSDLMMMAMKVWHSLSLTSIILQLSLIHI